MRTHTQSGLPVINSIYPSASIEVSSSNSYLVPTGFTGTAITCSTFGWPAPFVEWLYEGSDTLPDGVQFTISGTSGSASQSARLVFTTGFSSSHTGEYQCVVKESESANPSAVESRRLIETGTMVTPTAPPSCSVSNSQVNFQLRVLETYCTSWSNSLKEIIRNAFQEEIMGIVQIECNCTVSQNTILILVQPVCSTMVENGVVFRGTVETSSVSDTETVFCALSSWQQTNPSININNQLFQVDSGCSLWLNSFSDTECETVNTSTLDQMTLILVIAVPASGVLIVIVILLVLIICCVKCCRRHKTGSWSTSNGDNCFFRSVLLYIVQQGYRITNVIIIIAAEQELTRGT